MTNMTFDDSADAPRPPDDIGTREVLERRQALQCLATWAGSGVLWTVAGGIPRALAMAAGARRAADATAGAKSDADVAFSFAQISDTHVGFDKPANPHALDSMHEAIVAINARKPSLILHTGDITHLSKAEEFDAAANALLQLKAPVHYVPGEHDTLDEGGGKLYLERYGKGTQGYGWYSFDTHGVHFIALVNVFNFQAGRNAVLGPEQLAWLESDTRRLSASTPLVVFTHIPLWTIDAAWGWGTEDGPQALRLLRRFGSVTVLNGHIHQVIQSVEGKMTLHTARSTAYPQPAPGTADSPGPMTVAPEQLRRFLGITRVTEVRGAKYTVPTLSLTDTTLEQASATAQVRVAAAAATPGAIVTIDKYRFGLEQIHIHVGESVTWINQDEVPHTVVDVDRVFHSSALDTRDEFRFTFTQAGTYHYFCSLHPQMVGTVVVTEL